MMLEVMVCIEVAIVSLVHATELLSDAMFGMVTNGWKFKYDIAIVQGRKELDFCNMNCSIIYLGKKTFDFFLAPSFFNNSTTRSESE